MAEVAPQKSPEAVNGQPVRADERVAVGQTGASLFPEVVWAHFLWERKLHEKRQADETLENAYRQKLNEFEALEGRIISAYWSTHGASAVALTEGTNASEKRHGWREFGHRAVHFLHRLVGEDDSVMRLHRVTDWVTEDAAPIAETLHRCDGLAIRVSEVLRGPSERIAMQRIASVACYLLGFIERSNSHPKLGEAKRVARDQEKELGRIEDYYDRAGTKTGRIVYFWGMVAGVAVLLIIMAALAGFFWIAGLWDATHTPNLERFFAASAAGAMGAFVSVLQRMSSATAGFRVDYEVGRATVLRLGSFRPLIGAVSGVAIYFLLAGGLLNTTPPDGDRAFFYYGSLAFIAGFSERWTNVVVGGAERLIARSRGQTEDED
jgi:hypothetical protein